LAGFSNLMGLVKAPLRLLLLVSKTNFPAMLYTSIFADEAFTPLRFTLNSPPLGFAEIFNSKFSTLHTFIPVSSISAVSVFTKTKSALSPVDLLRNCELQYVPTVPQVKVTVKQIL